jgi:hypothetical protein
VIESVRSIWASHADALTAVSVASLVMLVGSIMLVPWLILRAPADVFVREAAPRHFKSPVVALLISLLRNGVGIALVMVGVLMLVLPGQGLLTIVVGLCLMDLPQRRELLRRVVMRPSVWSALAWIRSRASRPPFDPP